MLWEANKDQSRSLLFAFLPITHATSSRTLKCICSFLACQMRIFPPPFVKSFLTSAVISVLKLSWKNRIKTPVSFPMCVNNWENSFPPSVHCLSTLVPLCLPPSLPPCLYFFIRWKWFADTSFIPARMCLFPQNPFGVWDHREKCWKAGFEHWWNPNPQTVFKFASCPRNDGAPFCLQSSLLCNYFSGALCFLTLGLPDEMACSLGFSGWLH